MPSPPPLKAPKGISDEVLSLFDFTAKPTDAASLARNRVSKVLGKRRPSDADAAAPAALGSGSTIARLLREKAEDEQIEKKVARQTETLRDMERSDEATVALRERQAGAEALGRKIDARAAEVEDAFAGEVMDETRTRPRLFEPSTTPRSSPRRKRRAPRRRPNRSRPPSTAPTPSRPISRLSSTPPRRAPRVAARTRPSRAPKSSARSSREDGSPTPSPPRRAAHPPIDPRPSPRIPPPRDGCSASPRTPRPRASAR